MHACACGSDTDVGTKDWNWANSKSAKPTLVCWDQPADATSLTLQVWIANVDSVLHRTWLREMQAHPAVRLAADELCNGTSIGVCGICDIF